MRYILRLLFLFFIQQTSAIAGQYLTAGLGGGYSSNLFSDSFAVGNSYALYNITYSGANFDKIRLKYYYDLSYYQYDVGDVLNNVIHTPGISVYNRDRNKNLNWGIDMFAVMRDYVDPDFLLDNSRYHLSSDISYYFLPGFQGRLKYRLSKSDYEYHGNLNYYEHLAETELVTTLPTRTTFRGMARYSSRSFDLGGSYYWLDEEIGISQSINMKTGIGIRLKNRWSGNGYRPISSYYIISGINSYWDPWRGIQVESSIKRILPLAIVSNLEFSYWNRIFAYDPKLQQRLSWLNGISGRTDRGWIARIDFNKQMALSLPTPRAFNVSFTLGYSDNKSDDDYYKYRYFYVATNLKVRLF